MRLITYLRERKVRPGGLLDTQVIDLKRAYRELVRCFGHEAELSMAGAWAPADMLDLLNGSETSIRAAKRSMEFA